MTHNVTSITDYDHTYLLVVHEGVNIYIRKEYTEIEVNVDDTDIVELRWHWYENNSGKRVFYLDYNTVTTPSTASADELNTVLNTYLNSQFHYPSNEITSDHTLALTDAKRNLVVNSVTDVTITIPPNSSVDFHVGEKILIFPYNTGKVVFVGDTGVTLLSDTNFDSVSGPYTCAELLQVYTDVWRLCGSIALYLDPDVQDFVDATGITDNTIIAALNTFVINLKADGLWTQWIAMYPLVGGTATTHKYNLIDPRDLDAAYRLTMGGTITHDANGATMVTSGNMRTAIVPSAALTLGDHSCHVYLRNDDLTGNKMAYGVVSGGNYMQLNPPSTTFTVLDGTLALGEIGTTLSDSLGLFSINRVTDTSVTLYQNGSSVAANTADTITALPSTYDIWIGARNNTGSGDFFSTYNFAFACFGDSLTAGEISTFYGHVQTLQTALSRQV